MSSHAGNDRPRPFIPEERAGHERSGLQGEQPETGELHRAFRDAQWTQVVAQDGLVITDKRLHQPAVSRTVAAQPGGGIADRAVHRDGGAIVQRVRQGDRRLDPAHTQPVKLDTAEERRGYPQRMDRGADIVGEARQGDFA